MPTPHPDAIAWPHPAGLLLAVRPTAGDIDRHAPALAAFFNDDHNRRMMGNTCAMSSDDVREHYTNLVHAGDVPFFLFLDGELVGDADFRGLRQGRAEYTIAIGPRSAQGKGLGRAFALVTHAYAFARLPLERSLVAILSHNPASLRLFQAIGYTPDATPEARALVEEESESTLSITKARFLELHAKTIREFR